MASKALLVWGGWDGHQPKEVGERFTAALRNEGFEVEVSDTLDSFKDGEKLKQLDLIVPIWTMGEISGEQLTPLLEAVRGGVGLAGCHGGMCDAFRTQTEYQFMCGGQWVAHPGGDQITYDIKITKPDHPAMEGVKDFSITSEQYYMHVDPAVDVLATTVFTSYNNAVMPQVWTNQWGDGRVFYNAMGHQAKDFDIADNMRLMTQGMLWAAGKR